MTALEGGQIENGCITCPLHHARFDLKTGNPQPNQGWAGHLATYPIRVREGQVEIELPLGPEP